MLRLEVLIFILIQSQCYFYKQGSKIKWKQSKLNKKDFKPIRLQYSHIEYSLASVRYLTFKYYICFCQKVEMLEYNELSKSLLIWFPLEKIEKIIRTVLRKLEVIHLKTETLLLTLSMPILGMPDMTPSVEPYSYMQNH